MYLSVISSLIISRHSIAVISVFWLTEVVPIAVMALLPLILFPALGVLSAE